MEYQILKILLIEDNPGDARFLKEMLAEIGSRPNSTAFDLKCTERLSIGLELLRKEPFDIILLDLSLPDSHGLETFNKVQHYVPRVPIIVLSGLNDETVATQAVRLGAQDYLVKGESSGFLLSRAMRYAIERKNAEEALKEANQKLKELDKMKSDFISTVSHELRTPIAIMREGVSLCLDGVAGEILPTQRELLSDTLENIDRLTRLVADLLDISKIEAGKIVLRRKSIDFFDVVRKTVEGHQIQAKEKGIQFETMLPEGTLKLYIDPDKVTQIFDNLVNNAIRFTAPGGKITIEAKNKEDVVDCRVSDTGIGIAKENITKLFSKFEQFGRVDGPGYKGTGLGLAIVKGLVEKHKGKIWVESTFGKGTTFCFTLKKIPFPKILIVDDEKNIVDIIKAFLAEDNYQVSEANDGKEAIEKAKAEIPSIMILDMKLPGMNGYEVIGRLKEDIRTQKIPLLVMSAYGVDKERLDQVNDNQVSPIINKPFERDELRDRIQQMLSV